MYDRPVLRIATKWRLGAYHLLELISCLADRCWFSPLTPALVCAIQLGITVHERYKLYNKEIEASARRWMAPCMIILRA